MDETAGAILLAAGRGDRTGGPKQFVEVGGRPLLHWSLRAFLRNSLIAHVVVVLPSDSLQALDATLSGLKPDKPVDSAVGGSRRQDSVQAGLKALRACQWVVVHDAARPLLTDEMISQGLLAARATGAAAIGRPLADTVKRVNAGLVVETLSRDGLWAVQTPQVFRRELLEQAHSRVTVDVTDDAAMVELIGGDVRLFEGPANNVKVTTASDFGLVATLLEDQLGNENPRAAPGQPNL